LNQLPDRQVPTITWTAKAIENPTEQRVSRIHAHGLTIGGHRIVRTDTFESSEWHGDHLARSETDHFGREGFASTPDLDHVTDPCPGEFNPNRKARHGRHSAFRPKATRVLQVLSQRFVTSRQQERTFRVRT
jgi:hypothetical protein